MDFILQEAVSAVVPTKYVPLPEGMESINDKSLTDQTLSQGSRVGPFLRHLPNFITLVNLFCGCCAVFNVFSGRLLPAFWFFIAAIAADFFDGMAARLLGVHSPLGRELDSLADVVSFGFFPGSVFYVLLLQGWTGQMQYPSLYWGAAPGFFLTLFSALRLARFNLDTRQVDHFIGLPTPSAAVFTVGLMLIFQFDSLGLGSLVVQPLFLYPVIVLLSAALLAELPMFSLKFKRLTWSGNEIKIIFALTSILLLVLLREAALSLVIVLYLLISIIFKWLNREV